MIAGAEFASAHCMKIEKLGSSFMFFLRMEMVLGREIVQLSSFC